MPTSASWWRDWSRAFLRWGDALQLQHQPQTGRPRHADIHHRVLLLLERGEDRVTMIARALENLRLAGAAGALVTEVKRHRSDLINQREGRPRSTRVVQRVPQEPVLALVTRRQYEVGCAPGCQAGRAGASARARSNTSIESAVWARATTTASNSFSCELIATTASLSSWAIFSREVLPGRPYRARVG